MSAAQPSPVSGHHGLTPIELVSATSDALTEIAKMMLGIKLEKRGPVEEFHNEDLECGVCIGMTSPKGSWNVALFGSEKGNQAISRAFLGMTDDKPLPKDELADALGEILNMVAGVLKRKVPAEDAKYIQLGLPMYLSGTDCFKYLTKGLHAYGQTIAGSELDIEVILVWKEEHSS
jgi:CheY-specific phosphatase CheX